MNKDNKQTEMINRGYDSLRREAQLLSIAGLTIYYALIGTGLVLLYQVDTRLVAVGALAAISRFVVGFGAARVRQVQMAMPAAHLIKAAKEGTISQPEIEMAREKLRQLGIDLSLEKPGEDGDWIQVDEEEFVATTRANALSGPYKDPSDMRKNLAGKGKATVDDFQ